MKEKEITKKNERVRYNKEEREKISEITEK